MVELESYRKKMGMTQRQLANVLDADARNLDSVERGKRQLSAKQKAILEELIKSIPDPLDDSLQINEDLIVVDPSLKKELPYILNKLEKEQLIFERLTDKLENEKKEWLLYCNAQSNAAAKLIPEFEIKMRNARTRYRKLATRHQNLWLKIEILKTKVRCTRQIINQLQTPLILP